MTAIRANTAEPEAEPTAVPTGDHWDLRDPSPWVSRLAPLGPAGGAVRDLACGKGRHTRLFLERGHPVTAVDRDVSHLGEAARNGRATVIEADLEAGSWPLEGRTFSGIVVTNYLYRPLMPHMIAALVPGGVLIYEIFAKGNEAYGKPRSPDHLLAPGELLDVFGDRFSVVAYEYGHVTVPRPSVIQHICAVSMPKDEPPPLPAARG